MPGILLSSESGPSEKVQAMAKEKALAHCPRIPGTGGTTGLGRKVTRE